jgi:hypothetical protein
MEPLLTAFIHHGERSRGLDASAKKKKWATRARTPMNGVERACVVGTTDDNYIRSRARVNSGF